MLVESRATGLGQELGLGAVNRDLTDGTERMEGCNERISCPLCDSIQIPWRLLVIRETGKGHPVKPGTDGRSTYSVLDC